MARWRIGVLVAVAVMGCGKSDNLPQPRISPDDDEEEAYDVVEAPAAVATAVVPGGVSQASEAASAAASLDASPSEPATDAPAAAPSPASAAPPKPLSAAEKLAARPVADAPDEPLAPAERQAQTIENLQRIGRALESYGEDWSYFPSAYYSPTGQALLSWRVRLLPLLGFHALHQQFRLDEPWDSPHNLQLLPQIPPVFQSPERFDARTNYLAPDGAGLIYERRVGVALAKVTDGLGETIFVVEVDDERAVPWTKPDEFAFQPRRPRAGLGSLREGGFLGLLGNGQVRLVAAEAEDAAVRALFTIGGRDASLASQNTLDPTLFSVAASTPASLPFEPNPSRSATATAAGTGSGVPNSSSAYAPTAAVPVPANRLPVPDAAAQAGALAVVRDLFVAKYEKAKTTSEKQEVANEMKQYLGRLQDDPTSRYVVLRVACEIAADNGAIEVAKTICEQMVREFAVDAVGLNLTVVKRLANSVGERQEPTPRGENRGGYRPLESYRPARSTGDKQKRIDLAKWAKDWIEEAYREDNFSAAKEFYQIALALARSGEDREVSRDVMRRFGEIEQARREYSQVSAVMKVLDDSPDDPQANLVVGRYYCFVKKQWDRGLPMLLRGSDRALAGMAAQDLAAPASPESQVALADGWWKLASDYKDPQKAALQDRAALWYRAAIGQLPEGLLKIKAEMRLKEVEDAQRQQAAKTPVLEGF